MTKYQMISQIFSSVLSLILLYGFIMAGTANADQVRTKSGKVIEGIIVGPAQAAATSRTLKIRIGSTQITLPADQIESVMPATPTENMIIEARDQLRAKKAPAALATMTRALEAGAAPERLAALILNEGDRLAEAVPKLDERARAGLSRILAALESVKTERNADLLARRIQLHLCLAERDKAEALLSQLGGGGAKEQSPARKQLAQWLANSLDAWAAAGDFLKAREMLHDLSRLEPSMTEGRDIQFYLQWALHERNGGNFEKALEIYTQYLLDKSPQIARDRIETTLGAAERTLRETNQLEQAAKLYETFGLATIPTPARERLVQIWHDEGWRHLWRGEFADARAAFDHAELVKKGSAKLDLLQCEYRQRRAAIPQGDLIGRYELGLWCLEQKLPEAALEQFRAAEKSKTMGTAARGYIGQIMNQLSEAELAKIMGHYEAGDYLRVLKETHEFMSREHPKGYLAQAKQIEDVTRETMRLRVAERPQQAEALFQQAQRAFYQERYAEADKLLKTLADHYQDSVVYPRANAFHALVKQKLALAKLEQGETPAKADTKTSDTQTSATRITGAEIDRLIETLQGPKQAKGSGTDGRK